MTGSGSSDEIWLRASLDNGATFGPAIRISSNTYDSYNPSVAASGSYVYVAWMDDTPVPGSGGDYEVWMRISSNNGASFGSPIRLTTNTGWSTDPSIAASGSLVYVAWEDSTPVYGSGDQPEIWGRSSLNNGLTFSSPIRVSMNTGTSDLPSVAVVGSSVYVVWEDNTPVSGSGDQFEIWLRASPYSGYIFGSPIRISCNSYGSEEPSVAASGNTVYVTWMDWTPVYGSDSAPEIWLRTGS